MAATMTPYLEVELPVAPALLPNNLLVHRSGDFVSYAAPTSLVSVQTGTGIPCFPPLQLPAGTFVELLTGVTEPTVENLILVAALSDKTAIVVVNGQQTHCVSINSGSATEFYSCIAATRVGDSNTFVVALGGSEGFHEVRYYTLQGQPTTSTATETTASTGADEDAADTNPKGRALPVLAHERRCICAVDIAALGGTQPMELVSADVAGRIVLWRDLGPVAVIEAANCEDAVVAVKLCSSSASNDHFAAAFASGRINVYAKATGEVQMILHAHSRIINVLSYQPTTQCFVSAAEDGQIYVWRTATLEPANTCVAHGTLANELPTGAALLGEQKVVVQLSYDVSKLRLFSYP